MDPIEKFNKENNINSERLLEETNIQDVSLEWLAKTYRYRHPYTFTWMGVPIIQYPQDIMALQEVIWKVKPDTIIETGVAHGGCALFYASMLNLLGNNGKVIGVDIDIKEHNRKTIEEHPLSKNIKLIEGSSVAEQTLIEVKYALKDSKKVLVCLDSNHKYEHVLKELELYSPLVSKDSYLIVFDTLVEVLPNKHFPHRPFKRGNNPYVAVQNFLKTNNNFKVDTEIEKKLLITANPNGFLKRIK